MQIEKNTFNNDKYLSEKEAREEYAKNEIAAQIIQEIKRRKDGCATYSVTGYLPGELTWVGNSVHLYENHMCQASEQIERTPMSLPKLNLNHRDSIFDFQIEDFQIEDYNSHPSIKAPLSVGI